MDVLQQTHAALNLLIKEPRNPTNPLRDHLERVTDATERAFTAAREAGRGCETFRGLCAGDQRRIENVLFEVYPPWGNNP
jgi:hypothetical protein